MAPSAARPYLQSIRLLRETVPGWNAYPFSLPVVRHLTEIRFHPDVTFLVGENGSGKSTLIEAIAVLMRFNPEGGTRNSLFATASTHSELHRHLRPSRSHAAPKDGYFLRAESFYNLASYMDETGYLGGYGGRSLHAQSHGESFMAVLSNKLRGQGLYIFDEPEAALSPARQIEALAHIRRLVGQQSQFIIATHSPILLAYPGARICAIRGGEITEVGYRETDHYRITRDFLNDPERMLNGALAADDETG